MRIDISDRSVPKLAPGTHRDKKLAGFVVVVGARRRTFRYVWDTYAAGQRTRTESRKLGVWSPSYSAAAARHDAEALAAKRTLGIAPPPSRRGCTLREAMASYIQNLRVAGHTEKWINSQLGTFARRLQQWEHETLLSLCARPEEVRDLHREIGHYEGPPGKSRRVIGAPVEANKAMRLLKSIYRYAARADKLGNPPPSDPTRLVVQNPEARRDKSIPHSALAEWRRRVDELAKVRPLAASFHLLNLLTGMRPSALGRLRKSEVNLTDEDIMTGEADSAGDPIIIPAKSAVQVWTKSGRPLALPMSGAIERELRHAIELGEAAAFDSVYVFPSTARMRSASGHYESWTSAEDRAALVHAGAWCRHQYRSLAHELGIDPYSVAMLRGEAAQTTSQGYVSRLLMIKGPLRAAQEKISQRLEELMAGRS